LWLYGSSNTTIHALSVAVSAGISDLQEWRKLRINHASVMNDDVKKANPYYWQLHSESIPLVWFQG